MIEAKDYHKILGVPKKASKDEIKRAYRKLALIYHPDRNNAPDAEDRFKEINEAYRVLSGAERPPREGSSFDEQKTWAASVINRWQEIMTQKHNNMYR